MTHGPSRAAVAVLCGLCLLVGAAGGAIVAHRHACRDCDPGWSRTGSTWVDDQTNRLARALELTPEQREQVRALVLEVKPLYREAYAATQARRRAADAAFHGKLRSILRDEGQRERLERVLAQDERRRRDYYGAPPAGSVPAGEAVQGTDTGPASPYHDTSQ